jgi:uncharacterized protein (DUF1778 family)
MAITARPKGKGADLRQDKAEAFINGAAQKQADDIAQEANKIVTTLRFDPNLLKRIDTAAKRRGVSRTAYVMMAVSRAVEEGL